MSKWCNTCHRNELTGVWQSCNADCPVFGKDFEELAKIVVSIQGIKIKDERCCDNCGRLDGWNGCGEYVEDCMQDYDAYSNWIPKND